MISTVRIVIIVIVIAGKDTTVCQAPFYTHSTTSHSARCQTRGHGPESRIPQLVSNGAGRQAQAVQLQSLLSSPLPDAAFVLMVIKLILGMRLCASLSSSPPSLHEANVAASVQRLDPEASVLCQAGGGVLGLSDPLSSIGRK